MGVRAGNQIRPSASTAIIAEDEKALLLDLENQLSSLWPELKIVASVDNGTDALAMFEVHKPQMMFLDIEMPGLTGLEVAQQIGDCCRVVFITAYDSYAIPAFENGAVDYLLKPYQSGRLARAIERVKGRIGAPPALRDMSKEIAAAARSRSFLTWIKASHGNEVTLITVWDVCYFRADAKYTSVVTPQNEFIIRRSIKELVAELDPDQFWQVHRSTIVNIEAVSSVARSLNGEMVLKLKARPERLSVSEAHRHMFRHM